MLDIKKKLFNLIENTNKIRKISCNKFVFHFLFGKKDVYSQFKVNIDTKCLVLVQYPGAETKGLGGLIAQYPKNFEILCLTNGSNMLEDINPVESTIIKRQQFQDVMKKIRIKGSKIFDIDSDTLKNQYSTFKKIDFSEADYIFVPNIYDNNIDTIALLKHLKQALKDKEYKSKLKILMYESDFALSTFDYYVDISTIIETKKKMLKEYYPEDKYPKLTEKITGINAFRSICLEGEYCEAFLSFTPDEFIKIPLI